MFIISAAEFIRRNIRWVIVGLILTGFLLRLPGLWANTFHADEALFASWARLIAVWRDPLLQTQVVDKPPLLFYLQALFYPLLATPAGWPARLPNLIAGVLLIPLTGRLAHQLYRDRFVSLVAALIVCFSPLAIQFSPSAFIDPLLTTLLVAALVWVAARPDAHQEHRRFFFAGLLFGLAMLTKYQAVLFLPLILVVGWLHGWKRAQWARFATGFLPLLLLFLLWGIGRGNSPAAWGSQWQNLGGLRLIYSWELGPRLVAWGELGQAAAGSWLVGLLFIFTPLLVLWPGRAKKRPYTLDMLLLLFGLAYLALHWLVSIPVWDRYMLPLLPVLAVLAGRLLARIVYSFRSTNWEIRSTRFGRAIFQNRLMNWEIRSTRFSRAAIISLILVVVLLPGAMPARRGAWPVGAMPGADSGAGEVAAMLADEPYGTVLYDHWYSWQWRYYFFDRGVFVHWFAHPAALTEDLSVFGDEGNNRYLVLPAGDIARPVKRAVHEAGFILQPVHMGQKMILYRVQRP